VLTELPWLLAHRRQPPSPHELWTAWHLHPLVVLGLALPAAGYLWARAGGRRPHGGWSGRCIALGLGAAGLALLSPLDALAAALASAHMVQHVVLTTVAAPLLALGAPFRAHGGGLGQVIQRPVVAWLLHVGALWGWHSAALYDAALRHPLLHALEHLSFIVTAVLFWRAALGGLRSAASAGTGLVLVFTMALQGVLLSALLTFARAPWYRSYTTTRDWGLDPLTDQQLAGVVMWVPGGLVHLGAALALLAAWLHEGDGRHPSREPPLAA